MASAGSSGETLQALAGRAARTPGGLRVGSAAHAKTPHQKDLLFAARGASKKDLLKRFKATLSDMSADEAFERLASTAWLIEYEEELQRLLVSNLRQAGFTWARIGEALGMTRQSAWERFSGDE